MVGSGSRRRVRERPSSTGTILVEAGPDGARAWERRREQRLVPQETFQLTPAYGGRGSRTSAVPTRRATLTRHSSRRPASIRIRSREARSRLSDLTLTTYSHVIPTLASDAASRFGGVVFGCPFLGAGSRAYGGSPLSIRLDFETECLEQDWRGVGG